jgi:hypothetical protein
MIPSLDCNLISQAPQSVLEKLTRNIISQSVNPSFSLPGTSYPSLPKYPTRFASLASSSGDGLWNVSGMVHDAEGVLRKVGKSQVADIVAEQVQMRECANVHRTLTDLPLESLLEISE